MSARLARHSIVVLLVGGGLMLFSLTAIAPPFCPPFVPPQTSPFVPAGGEACWKCSTAPTPLPGLAPLRIAFADGSVVSQASASSEVEVCFTGPPGHTVYLLLDSSGYGCPVSADAEPAIFQGIRLGVSAFAGTVARGVLDSSGALRIAIDLSPFRYSSQLCLQAVSMNAGSQKEVQTSNTISLFLIP